jgi:hypothetical protein
MNPLVTNVPIINISSLVSKVYSDIRTDLQSGGYGLDPNNELALWNAERDKLLSSAQETMEITRNDFAVAGFPVFPGIMHKAFKKIYDGVTDKISDANRKIASDRATLYWDGKQFAVKQGLRLENISIEVAKLFVEEDKIESEIVIAEIRANSMIVVAQIHADAQIFVAWQDADARVYAAMKMVRTWHISSSDAYSTSLTNATAWKKGTITGWTKSKSISHNREEQIGDQVINEWIHYIYH